MTAKLLADIRERIQSAQVRAAFPEIKGVSRTNRLYMRAFSEAWPEEAIIQQDVGQIP